MFTQYYIGKEEEIKKKLKKGKSISQNTVEVQSIEGKPEIYHAVEINNMKKFTGKKIRIKALIKEIIVDNQDLSQIYILDLNSHSTTLLNNERTKITFNNPATMYIEPRVIIQRAGTHTSYHIISDNEYATFKTTYNITNVVEVEDVINKFKYYLVPSKDNEKYAGKTFELFKTLYPPYEYEINIDGFYYIEIADDTKVRYKDGLMKLDKSLSIYTTKEESKPISSPAQEKIKSSGFGNIFIVALVLFLIALGFLVLLGIVVAIIFVMYAIVVLIALIRKKRRWYLGPLAWIF